jgi:membrane protease subunit HflC
MQRILPYLIGLAILIAAASSCLFVVREQDYALVFALGEYKKTVRDPGLYWKLPAPLQNVVLLDKRLQTIESKDPERIQTSEKKNLLIDSFVKWRIVDPRQFYVTFGANTRVAEERLSAQIRDALNASVNTSSVKEVISSKRSAIMSKVQNDVDQRALPLGVEVVDVRLRRIEFVSEISGSVFSRMEAERKQEANRLRASGAAESERIRAEADRKRQEELAKNFAKAQGIRGEGDAKAAAVYAEAYGKNPEFFRFYRSLEGYEGAFNGPNDILVLSPESDFFRYWKHTQAQN